jgi:hypothetical protein
LFGKGLRSIGLDKRHDIDGELISDYIIGVITRSYMTRT